MTEARGVGYRRLEEFKEYFYYRYSEVDYRYAEEGRVLERNIELMMARREARIAKADYQYKKLRKEAVEALGGMCPKCQIERDPAFLYIEALTEIAKKWSQNLFYRRVAEYPDRTEFARLICGNCRTNERKLKWSKVKAIEDGKKEKGTGMFYWVAGERIEQPKRKVEIRDGLQVVNGRLADLPFPEGDSDI